MEIYELHIGEFEMEKTSNVSKFLNKLLASAVALRDKRGNKLNPGSGLCTQLKFQARDVNWKEDMFCDAVQFFANRLGIVYMVWMDAPWKWSKKRKKVLLSMIEGLQDRKIRQLLVKHLKGLQKSAK
jgi:hypothetical protein